MIRLGIDAAGSSLTSAALSIEGLSFSASSAVNLVDFNSVFIGGTGVVTPGAANSACYIRTTAETTTDLRDNIFVNNRSNSTGTGKHYLISLDSLSGVTSNYNDFNQTGTGAVFGVVAGTDATAFANWKANTSQDANSIFSDPKFIFPTSAAATVNLHIDPTLLTAVEGSGILISPPTDDFDGQTRSTLTPVDMGADAGNFNFLDATPPAISYSALGSTTSTANRTLSITVTDATGVPTSGTGLPRLYFRKGTSGAYVNTACSFVSGSSYTCTIDYSLVTGGSVTGGDTVQYYVAAQDTAPTPNVTTNPAVGASGFTATPPAASTPPTAPSSYSISFTGSISICNGGTYPTLKSFFDAVNNPGTVLAGNLIVNIAGNCNEAASAVLNQWTESPANSGYTMTIQPSGGAARTISGTINGSPLIDLNGADRVTVDGLNTGGNSLTISNASTSATADTSTVRFINDATSNTIQNCTISGSSTLVTTGTVFFSTTTGTTGNDGNIINNNNIGPAGASLPFNAIYASGTTTTTTLNNSGVQITNNKIFDFFAPASTSAGVLISTGNTDFTITGNSFYQTATRTATAAATVYGISIANTTSGNNFIVSSNFIGGSTVNAGGTAWTIAGVFGNRFNGIGLSVGTTTPSSVQGNTIANFSFVSNSSATANSTSSPLGTGIWGGIYVGAGSANVGTTTGNTIGSGTGTSSITVTGSTNPGATANGMGVSGSGTVNFSNNIIGSITTSGATGTLSTGIIGINSNATGTVTLNNNTIGSTTTANSLNASLASTGVTAQVVNGIKNTGAATLSITNNTIANATDAYVPSAVSSSNIMVGISSTAGVNTITGNTIRNFTTAANATGTGSAAAVIGLLHTGTTAGQSIGQNTIHSLSESHATAAVNIYGIYWSNSSTTGNIIERNFIHSLTTPSTGAAIINGIYQFNGSSTYRNNMIRLGLDAAGSSLTSASIQITGILADPVGTNNYYFNSIFIGGTNVATGSASTAGFRRVTAADVTDFRDNIVVNNRSNSTGTGKHYAIALISGSTTFTSNYNVFNQTGTGAVFGVVTATDSTTFANWKTNTSQDANSFLSDPQFLTPNGTSATVDLHINPSVTTLVEGSGILISPPTDDFDGQTRSTLTPVDIGADAGNFTGLDATPPVITYTTLGNTTSTANRTLTITVTDASGVPTSGTGLPRLYFRKGVSGAYATTQCVFVSGSNYTCTFDYSLVTGASVTAGDTIQYYVAAQDGASTPNVTTNPSTGASGFTANPPAASTPPTTPSSYKIATAISGSINVGTAQTYTSLTNTGGFFDTVNNNVVTGNVTVNITSDLTGETGTVALNQWTEEGAGSYTMSIRPSGAARSITGTGSSTILIKLNGADRVTFDGSIGGGGVDRSLTINNSNTASGTTSMFIASLGTGAGATNDTIKNCIIKTGSIGTTANVTFGIFVGDTSGAAAGADNDNLTIQNNQVLTARTGIQIVGVTSTGIDDNTSITGNLIGDNILANSIGRFGLVLQVANTATISGNTVKNIFLASDTSSATGMSLATLTGSSVSQNTITGITNSTTASLTPTGLSITGSSATSVTQNAISSIVANGSTSNPFGMFTSTSTGMTVSQNTIDTVTSTTSGDPIGMSLSTSFVSSTVSRNTVSNVTYTGTGGYGGRGIDISTGSGSSALQISNNSVSNIKGDGWNSFASDSIAGIRISGTTGGLNVYFNSVNLGSGSFAGNSSGTLSAAFYLASTVTALDLRDNIFASNLVNSNAGAAKTYAIYSEAANTAFTTINYNDYFTSGAQGVRGFLTSDRTDLAGIQAGFGQNANSIITDPLFNSATNLQPQLGSPVLDTGVSLSGTVTPYVDITGATRIDPPSMGAYETGSDTVGPTISYALLVNTTSTSNRSFTAVTITDASGVNGTAGTRPRVYYKRSVDNNAFVDNTSGTNGWKFVEANGSSSPFDFTINYSLLNGGTGVTGGQTVQYFVVAQDLATTPNVSINSGTFAVQPTSVALTSAAFPIGGTINSYQITASISGTKTVCASTCDYTSLTGAAGVFNAINTSVATGNIEIQIAGDLTTGETGAVALNALSEEPTGSNFTVKIYPTGTTRAITSTTAPAGGFIRLNAADRVTIDGSIGGTGTDRSLTITEANTSATSAVVWLQSSGSDGATSNTIKNLNVVGNANTTTLIGIGMGANGDATVSVSSLGTGNNSNTIQNNNISKTQYGIYSQGASAASKNTGNAINQNLINTASPNNVQIGGIMVGFENSITISQNNIAGMSRTSSVFGIAAGFVTSDFSATTFTGNEVTNATISRNKVDNLTSTSVTGFSSVGIAYASAATGTTQISNNMISRVSDQATSPDFNAGIYVGGGAGTLQIYYNSVWLSGSRVAATYPSYALAIGGSTPTVDVKDNVLENTSTSAGTGKSYAIGLAYTSTAGNYANLTSNYNDLLTSGISAAFSKVGGLAFGSGTEKTTLAAWQTETGRDTPNTISLDPLFTSTSDLHINPATTATSPVNNAGVSIGSVTNDFDNDSRSATPDIGADEFVVNVSSGGSGNLAAGTYDNVTVNGPDTLTLTGNVVINGCLIVNSGATLNTGIFVVSGPGCFTLNSGGTLGIGSTVGITTGATGNVQVTTRTFSNGGNYIYNGNANQAVGNALPATVANLTILNTGTSPNNIVTGNSGQTVTGLLRVQSGQYAGASTYNNVQIDNGATMTAASAGTINVSGNWSNSGTFGANSSTVIFNGNGNTQTLSGSTSFANLTINHANAGGVTASGSTLAVTGLMRVQGGSFTSSSTYNNVQIDATGTLISDGGTITVTGDWTNDGGTFTPSTGTVTFNSASAGQSITGAATSQTFNILNVSKTGQTLGLGGSLATLNVGTLNVNAGTFDQGTAASVASGPITIAAGATLKNLGTGDLTLSSTMANAGTITFDGSGGGCGSADSILIRSSATGTQRAWSGTGTFTLTDVDVRDQAGTAIVTVFSGTNTANNGANWVFIDACTGAGGNTYVWVGPTGPDDSWINPVNWKVANSSPATPRTLAAANDVLIFDGSNTPSPSVSAIPTQTISALRVINGAFPSFSTTAANTLTIDAGAGGLGFDVDSLNISGANALTIKLASGTLGRVTGVMTVGGGAHKLIGQAASAITFQTSSNFTTTTGFTGNPFGDGSIAANGAAGSIVFASGSTYSHNAGSSPFGASGNPSVVTFQTGSLAQYITATGFDANGRTYANLTIGKADPGGIAIAASDSGTGNFQFDDLTVNSTASTSSSLTYTGSGASAITIQGNITSTGTGNTGTLPDILLTPGSGGITINKPSGTATFSNTGNSRSIDFEGNTTVTNTTTLTLSRIVQLGFSNPNNNTLTVNATGSINGSATGYVIGSVKKISVAAAFIFPVGTPNGYSPVQLTTITGTGDFTASASQSTIPGLAIPAKGLKRYWTLTNGGLTDARVKFSYLDPTDISGTEANYRIVKDTNGTGAGFTFPDAGADDVDDATNTATLINPTITFSNWSLVEPDAPTAVKLMSFTATRDKSGEVTLNWLSGYEAHNLGYYVYREENGKRVQITPSLVAGSALTTGLQTAMNGGLAYTWNDNSGQWAVGSGQKGMMQPDRLRGATYWLEDVDLDGTRTLHGPIAAEECNANCKSLEANARLRSPLLNELNQQRARERNQGAGTPGTLFRGYPAALKTNAATAQSLDPDPIQIQRWLAKTAGLKISVGKTGWYRVGQPELVAAGLDTNAPQQLQLYTDGRELPMRVSGDGNALDVSDYIEFYGQGIESTTEGLRTYYLVSGEAPGKRVKISGQGPLSDTPVTGNFADTIERRDRWIYYAAFLNGAAENIFGHVVSSTAMSETLPVNHPDRGGNAARLEVSLVGVSLADHHVLVNLNGQDVGTIDFSGAGHPTGTFTVDASLVQEGDNTVQLTSLGGADVSLVDTVRLTYSHTYAADNDALQINVSDQETRRISGFTNKEIRLVDITDQNHLVELTPPIGEDPDGTFTADVYSPNASFRHPHTLLAFAKVAVAPADGLKKNDPSAWWSQRDGADYLVITSREFKDQVQPLAQLRRSQGLVVKVIDVEDVYDEFSFGEHTPQAIKDFLQSAQNTWIRKPRYVLLAGDASYDPKNYLGQGHTDFVPTKLFDTSLMETASDDWLADFNGDGVADLAVGRLPMRTAADAELMVGKIISYENSAPDPQRGALLVADTGFESQSVGAQNQLPPTLPQQVINRSSADDTTIHNQIIASLNQGPRLVNFVGHGGNGTWTGAQLLTIYDAPDLTNSNHLSVFVMMTCMNGYFQNAYIDSLGESLLRNQGGAVAVWASTGMTDSGGQSQIDQELYRQMFVNSPPTLGDAVRAARLATSDADVRRTWILFGDPAMRLR